MYTKNKYLKAICNKQPLSQGFCYNFKNEAVEVTFFARNKQDKSKVGEHVLPSNTVQTTGPVQLAEQYFKFQEQ